jgi:hypothetical protein
MPQGETLKLQEDGIKKSSTEQSGYQFKNALQPARNVRKTPCTSRPAGEIDRSQYRKALKK